jgi:hypothetical protein
LIDRKFIGKKHEREKQALKNVCECKITRKAEMVRRRKKNTSTNRQSRNCFHLIVNPDDNLVSFFAQQKRERWREREKRVFSLSAVLKFKDGRKIDH